MFLMRLLRGVVPMRLRDQIKVARIYGVPHRNRCIYIPVCLNLITFLLQV